MKTITDKKKIEEVLSRGVDEVIIKEHLQKRMLEGEVLRIKFGIDPTSPHMHLGHTVPLRKLRQFQDLGHQAVLIIGDATAMIGDPTGRSEARNQLTREVIDENKKTYLDQASKILDMDKLEVHYNGEWFDPMSAADFLGLTSLATVQQILQRDDFKKRVDSEDNPLTALEMTYPVMQGYDSVQVKADVELGGADQKLNLLMGRRIQRKMKMDEQDILTVPLLIGTDGEKKMSKSFDNAIFLESEVKDKFGQIMSIPDELIINYFTVLTSLSIEEIKNIEESMKDGGNPRDYKVQLAKEIINIYHGADEAEQAEQEFEQIFKDKEKPTDLPEKKIDATNSLIDLLIQTEMVPSKSEGRRLVEQGGVKINDVKVEDWKVAIEVKDGDVIQVGKRKFVKIVL